MALTTAELDLFRLYVGPLVADLTAGEVELFVNAGEGSVARGVGLFYLVLAGDAAVKAKVVKDYDLSVSTEKRPEELRVMADQWFAQADREALVAGDLDLFQVHSYPGKSLSPNAPEASPRRVVF